MSQAVEDFVASDKKIIRVLLKFIKEYFGVSNAFHALELLFQHDENFETISIEVITRERKKDGYAYHLTRTEVGSGITGQIIVSKMLPPGQDHTRIGMSRNGKVATVENFLREQMDEALSK